MKIDRKHSKLLLAAAYLFIWLAAVLAFWLGGGSDALGYSIIVFYLLLPLSTLLLSVLIGQDVSWGRAKWLMLLYFGVMSMLAPYVTFSLANMLAFDKLNFPILTDMLPGLLCALIGLWIGLGSRHFRSKRI